MIVATTSLTRSASATGNFPNHSNNEGTHPNNRRSLSSVTASTSSGSNSGASPPSATATANSPSTSTRFSTGMPALSASVSDVLASR